MSAAAASPSVRVGDDVAAVETPALVIDQDAMRRVATSAGWRMVSSDLGLLRRDAIMVLQAPL